MLPLFFLLTNRHGHNLLFDDTASQVSIIYSLQQKGTLFSLLLSSQRENATLWQAPSLTAQVKVTASPPKYYDLQPPVDVIDKSYSKLIGLISGDLTSLKDKIKKKYGFELHEAHHYVKLTLPPPRAARSYIPKETHSTGFLPLDIMLRLSAELTQYSPKAQAYLQQVTTVMARLSASFTLLELSLIYLMYFSEQTALVRHSGNHPFSTKGRDWMIFSDWETCITKLEYVGKPSLDNQVDEWLLSPPIARDEVFYAEFIRQSNMLAREIFLDFNQSLVSDLSYTDFLTRPELWGTPGSAYVPKVSRTNKWEAYAELTDQQLKRLMTQSFSEPLKPVAKYELTKVRAVISSPLSTHLQMTYLEFFLLPALDGKDFTTLFMSPSQRRQYNRRFSTFTGEWRMPVDQSHFDWQPDMGMIYVWLALLSAYAIRLAPPRSKDDVREIVSVLFSSVNQGKLTVLTSNGPRNVMHGLPSGWKWTALLGSLINLSELRALATLTSASMTLGRPVVQGDDINLYGLSRDDLLKLVEAYAVAGFDVNPKKFWISKERDEFLRRVATSGIIAGYPARSLYKLLYQLSPPAESTKYGASLDATLTETLRLDGEGRIFLKGKYLGNVMRELDCNLSERLAQHRKSRTNELVSNWGVFLSRILPLWSSGIPAWISDWFMRDCAKATSIAWDTLSMLLSQPASLGGYNIDLGQLKSASNGRIRVQFDECLIPLAAQVRSAKDYDMKRLIDRSVKRDRYRRVFSTYPLSKATLNLWASRFGDQDMLEQLSSPHHLDDSRGFPVVVVRPSVPKNVKVVPSSSWLLSGARQALDVIRRQIPEYQLLRSPSLFEAEVAKSLGLSNTLARKILYLMKNAIQEPQSVMLDAFQMSQLSRIAVAANDHLLSVGLREWSVSRLSYDLYMWKLQSDQNLLQLFTVPYSGVYVGR